MNKKQNTHIRHIQKNFYKLIQLLEEYLESRQKVVDVAAQRLQGRIRNALKHGRNLASENAAHNFLHFSGHHHQTLKISTSWHFSGHHHQTLKISTSWHFSGHHHQTLKISTSWNFNGYKHKILKIKTSWHFSGHHHQTPKDIRHCFFYDSNQMEGATGKILLPSVVS